ncbi:hypothetical protein J6590_034405 [Homalodisca vitripennis]|nr:hypothetical protein J6590_034405 [Homalodisca vitripennis]
MFCCLHKPGFDVCVAIYTRLEEPNCTSFASPLGSGATLNSAYRCPVPGCRTRLCQQRICRSPAYGRTPSGGGSNDAGLKADFIETAVTRSNKRLNHAPQAVCP